MLVVGFLIQLNIQAQTKSTVIKNIDGVEYYIHSIEKGQSLYSLSKLYNVPLDEIYSLNPEAKVSTKPGQELKIPVRIPKIAVITPTASTQNINSVNEIDSTKYKVYKVASKETIYAITKKFKISEIELKRWNPGLNAQTLKEGQVIIVGEKKPSSIRSVEMATVASVNLNEKMPVADTNKIVIRKEKKNAYQLALLLPFRFDELENVDVQALVKNKSNFPSIPSLALDFYLGFKRAVDSLSKPDFSLSVNLYDIDDKDSAKLAQTVVDPKFEKTDFIFGPLHIYGFKPMAKMAKDFQTPIVSPLTSQNKILFDNIFVSKTNPSQFTLMEELADYCIDSLIKTSEKIILAVSSMNDKREQTFVKAFKKYYNDKQLLKGKTLKDTIQVVRGLVGVKGAYKSDVKNIVIVLSSNEVFISDFTTQLAIFAQKKDITLCGWESVSSLENIDQEYLNQLHYTFPCQYNLTNTGAYKNMVDEYKADQNAFPSEYFFIGFDMAIYYLNLLKLHGPGYVIYLDQFPSESSYMRFKFVHPDNNTGFDNRGGYIFTYTDYSLRLTGWK